MHATFRARDAVPIVEWGEARRYIAEGDLRARCVQLAIEAGADVAGQVEVDVTWTREAELWRDPAKGEDAPAETRTVMVGVASLQAEVDDDGAPRFVTLARDTAEVLLGEGAAVAEAGRDSTLVCGSPMRRHQFLHAEAVALKDGVLTSAVCGDCGERVNREALLRLAALEADGVRWWE